MTSLSSPVLNQLSRCAVLFINCTLNRCVFCGRREILTVLCCFSLLNQDKEQIKLTEPSLMAKLPRVSYNLAMGLPK